MSDRKSIWCHPDNEALLWKQLNEAPDGPVVAVTGNQNSVGNIGSLRDIIDMMRAVMPVKTNKFMDKAKPTGRIITPDGKRHDRKGFSWKWDRFVTLEESDLKWAIPLGIVREEVEPVFYMIDEPKMDFKVRFDLPVVIPPQRCIVNSIF